MIGLQRSEGGNIYGIYYETWQHVFRPIQLQRLCWQALQGLGNLQDQGRSAGAQDHGRKGTAGWYIPRAGCNDGGGDALQVDSHSVQQAQVVAKDLHAIRCDGAEPDCAVYRQAEGARPPHLRHRAVLRHAEPDPMRSVRSRREAGAYGKPEEAAAVQHVHSRSPHTPEDRLFVCC